MPTQFGTNSNNTLIVQAEESQGLGGDDTYIISSVLTGGPDNAGRTLVIRDTEGANRIQLTDGLQIASMQFLSSAVEILLSNNARIQILGAATFTFDIGGNTAAEDNTGLIGRSFTQFVADFGVQLVNGIGSYSGPVIIQPGPIPLPTTTTPPAPPPPQPPPPAPQPPPATPAVIGDPSAASVTEDLADTNSNLLASGFIPISDANSGEAAFQTTVTPVAGNLGTLVLQTSGSYTYMVANNAVQYLGAVQTKIDTFTVTALDGTAKSVSFTINGANDPAVIGSTVGGVTEDLNPVGVNLIATGTLSITDPDQSQSGFQTAVGGAIGNLGSLALTREGNYTYRIANADTQFLVETQVHIDSFTVIALDGTAKVVNFTITGAYDAAVIGDPNNPGVTEDANVNGSGNLTASGSIAITDADQSQASFRTTVTSAAGNLGSLSLQTNGSYTYTVANSATQYLGANQTKVDSFTITSLDGTTKDVSFTVNGANEPPVLVAPTAIGYTDRAADDTFNAVSGTLSATDRDNDTLTYGISGVTAAAGTATKVGTYGTLAVTVTTGAYTYTPNDAAIEALKVGAIESFTVTTSDGSLTDSKTLTVNLMGANDTPMLVTPTAIAYTDTAADDSFNTAAGTLSATDRDNDTPSYGITGGTDNGATVSRVGSYGILTVTKATGAYTYTPNDAAIEGLKANTSETFTITASDGALSDSKTLTINLTGANDTPDAVADALGTSEDTPITFTAAQLLDNDSDRDDGAAQLSIGSVTSGTGGVVVRNSDGSVTFTPTPNFNGAASFTYTTSDGSLSSTPAPNDNTATLSLVATVTVAAVNDAPTIAGVPTTSQTVTAGTAAALADFTVADVDSTSLTVTLTPTNGSVGGVTDADANTAGIQITGSAAAINTALAGATFTGTAGGAGSIAISVSVSDSVAPAVTASYPLTVQANVAPVYVADSLSSAVANTLSFRVNDSNLGQTLALTPGFTPAPTVAPTTVGQTNSDAVFSIALAAQATASTTVLNVTDGLLSTGPLASLYLATNNADTFIHTLTTPVAAFGFGGDDSLTGGTGNDILDGGTGNDTLTGGAGVDSYHLGAGDAAADTVVENGSALTVAAGAITGFDVVRQYGNGTDVLNFTPAMGATRAIVTGTFANGFFTPGTATTDNDVLVYGEAGTAGVTTGELGVVLVGVGAGGMAANVDINGAANGNGQNGAPAVTNIVLGSSITYTAVDAEMDPLTLRITPVGGTSTTQTTTGTAPNFVYTPTEGGFTATPRQGVLEVFDGTAATSLVNIAIGQRNQAGRGVDNTFSATDADAGFNTALAVAFYGFGGNDTLTGGSLADYLDGGTGTDTVTAYNLSTDGSDQINLGTESVTSATLNDVVNVSATGATQIRVTFTSANVGNGTGVGTSADTANTVTLRAEDGTGEPAGTTGYADDEGTTFIAPTGTTFDVRDISGTQRGDQFTKVVLGSSGGDNFDFGTGPILIGTSYYINAGAGNDTVIGTDGNDFLVGGSGDDSLTGGAGNDSYIGGTGNDTIVGTAQFGNDTGVDVVVAYNLFTDGSDQINLGTEVSLASAAALDVVNISNNGDVRVVINTANVGNSVGEGTSADAALAAASRNTLILQSTGAPGGTGYADDEGLLLIRSDGRFVVSDAATPTVNNAFLANQNLTHIALGTSGDDTLAITASPGGSVYLLGGNGNDTLSVIGTSPSLIDGGAGNDTIVGSGSSDLLIGGTGDDQFSNVSSGATVQGGDGNDVLVAGPNNNNGSYSPSSDASLTGVETVRATTGSDNINITLSSQSEGFTILGNSGMNLLVGSSGNDSIDAGAGNDRLDGGMGNDNLTGGAGDDNLTGGLGNDSLAGGADNDNLEGSDGNDALDGGAGSDQLDGGAGIDTYSLGLADNAIDTVRDNGNAVAIASGAITGFDLVQQFTPGQDVLVFNSDFPNGRQLSGTFNSANRSFTLGNASTDNDVIVFTDSIGSNNMLDAGESALVLQGVAAGGMVVDLNGGGAGNGYLAGTVNPPPAITQAATFSASPTPTVTFTATDASALSARIGTTAVSLGTVNNGTPSTLTLAAQTTAVQGELNVFDGTSGTNLGFYVGLGDGNANTFTHSGSNPAVFIGGGGNDSLTGGAGNDTFIASAVDVQAPLGVSGASNLFDTLNGGNGIDTLVFNGALTFTAVSAPFSSANKFGFANVTGVEVLKVNASTGNLQITLASGDGVLTTGSLRTFDLSGSSVNGEVGLSMVRDLVTDTGFTIIGGSGNDFLVGSSLTTLGDSISGGAGDDILSGSDGSDTLDGGAGNDTVTYISLSKSVSGINTSTGTTLATVGIDLVALGAGDRFQLPAVRVSSGGSYLVHNNSTPIAISVGTAGTATTGTALQTAIASAVTEASNTAFVLSITDAGTGNTFSGSYLLVNADGDTLFDGNNDLLVRLQANPGFSFTANGSTYLNFTPAPNAAAVVSNVVLASPSISYTAIDAEMDALTLRITPANAPTTHTAQTAVAGASNSFTYTPTEQATALAGVLNVFDGTTPTNIANVFLGDANANNAGTATFLSNLPVASYGFGGNDTLSGSDFADLLDGGADNDNLTGGTGVDTLTGGAGDDTFVFASGQLISGTALMDSIVGGDGTDTLRVSANFLSIQNTVSFARASGVETLAVEGTQGGGGPSTLIIRLNADAFTAGVRTVTLADFTGTIPTEINASGQSNANIGLTLVGSARDDSITGGTGADTLMGGVGNDQFIFTAQSLFAAASGALTDSIVGGDGTDTFLVNSTTGVVLTSANDWGRASTVEVLRVNGAITEAIDITLNASAFAAGLSSVNLSGDTNAAGLNRVDVTAADTATAFQLAGSTGADALLSGAGNDTLAAAAGADTLTGGAGVDVYQVGSNDNAIDTVVEDGSAVAIASGSITGFDRVEQFAKGQDVLTFNPTSTFPNLQLAGTYNSAVGGSFTLGNATTNNDVIAFNDANNNGTLEAGERAVVLVGVTAGGGVVDLNGGGAGNGYAAGMLPVPANTAPGVTNVVLGSSITYTAVDAEMNPLSLQVLTGTSSVIDLTPTGTAPNFSFTPVENAGSDQTTGVLRVSDGTAHTPFANIYIGNAELSSISSTSSVFNSALPVAFYGFAGSDNLTGGALNDFLSGGLDIDNLTGAGGADTLDGGNDNDVFLFPTFTDLFATDTSGLTDSIIGGAGPSDRIRITSTSAFTITANNEWSRANTVEILAIGANAADTSITLSTSAFTAGIRTVDLQLDTNAAGTNTVNASAAMTGQNLALQGSAGADNFTGGAGIDNLTGNAGADTLAGGSGIDTYNLGNNDGAIDTVTENGTALTISGPAQNMAFTSFDTINQFTPGTDVLNFNSGTGLQLSGTVSGGTFTAGTTQTHDDVIVFIDANNNGALNAGELAVALIGVNANGGVVDLNGGGAGNGNGYVPTPSLTATTDKLAMTDGLNSSATAPALQAARFSLATLLANDVGTGLSITAVGGVSGAVTGVTLNADGTLSVQSADNASATSGQIVTGSFTYTLSNGSTTTTGTVNVDVFNSTTAGDNINVSSGGYQTAYLSSGSGNDTLVGTSGNDTLIGGTGQDTMTGGGGNDLFRFLTQQDSPVDQGLLDARTGADVITDFMSSDLVSFGSIAGSAANYRESMVNGTGGAPGQFLAAADLAHGEGTNNGIRYFFGADSTSTNGYLSFDINTDALIDGNIVVVLQGVNTLAGFDFTNIIGL